MTNGTKRMLILAAALSAIVGIAAAVDLAVGIPFARYSVMMDVMFLICSILIGLMVRECFAESR